MNLAENKIDRQTDHYINHQIALLTYKSYSSCMINSKRKFS